MFCNRYSQGTSINYILGQYSQLLQEYAPSLLCQKLRILLRNIDIFRQNTIFSGKVNKSIVIACRTCQETKKERNTAVIHTVQGFFPILTAFIKVSGMR